MKNNDKNSNESLQKNKYKKRFLVRQIETKEAEEQIKEYDPYQEAFLDDLQDIQLPKVD